MAIGVGTSVVYHKKNKYFLNLNGHKSGKTSKTKKSSLPCHKSFCVINICDNIPTVGTAEILATVFVSLVTMMS